MTVTKGQVDAAVQIMKLALAAQRVPLSPRNIMDHSLQVATLVASHDREVASIQNAMIAQMITIRAEVK